MEVGKKFLLVFLLIGLMGISVVSAFEFDNVKDYDEDTRTATFSNSILGIPTTDIARVTLISPLNVEVGLGYQKVAEMEVEGFVDYDDILRQMDFYDLNDMATEISRTYDLKLKVISQIEVTDYTTECNDTFNETLNETFRVCMEVVGSHFEDAVSWETLTPVNLLENQIMVLGVFTDVQEYDYVDWVPEFFGDVRVEEWASWTADINIDILAHWKLDETLGTTFVDSAGPFDGVRTGGTIGVIGKIETAYDFAETIANYMSVADNEELSFNPGLEDFTISAWVMFDGTGNYDTIIMDRNTGDGAYSYMLRFDSTEHLLFGGNNLLGGSYTATTTKTYLPNVWYNVVGVVSGGNATLYVNGEQDASVTFTPFAVSSDLGVSIGIYRGGGFEHPFDGTLDEITIWNRALSSTEINDVLYNLGDGTPFIDPESIDAEVLLVAAGGDGGNYGGGGAGGLIHLDSFNLTERNYTITVGEGVADANGENSEFSIYTAVGGGRGAGNGGPATIGGSGGAGAQGGLGSAGIAGQGYAGGDSLGGNSGGGGGGASQVGYNGGVPYGGNGGDGLMYNISGTDTYYAGGGGGSYFNIGTAGVGGLGGGGNGTDYDGVDESAPAIDGTGGGGSVVGVGGSGIVILSYNTVSAESFEITGGTKTVVGDDTIHTFTSSDILSVELLPGTSVELVSPLNASTSNIEIDTFSYNAIPVNDELVNGTLYIWNATSDVLVYSNTTSLSGIVLSLVSENLSLDNGDYIWNAEVCVVDAGCVIALANSTFTKNYIPLTIVVDSPTGQLLNEYDYPLTSLDYSTSETADDCSYVYYQTTNTSMQYDYSVLGHQVDFDIRTGLAAPQSYYTMRRDYALQALWINQFGGQASGGMVLSGGYPAIPDCTSINYGTSWNQVAPIDAVNKYVCVRVNFDEYYLIETTDATFEAEKANFYPISAALDCSGNSTPVNFTDEFQYIQIFAADNYSQTTNETSTWSYIAEILSSTESAVTIETSSEDFELEIEYDSAAWTTVRKTLVYNGTNYTGTTIGTGDNVNVSATVFIPALGVETNYSFYWLLEFVNATGTYGFTTTEKIQSVELINFTECDIADNPQVIFTTYDERNPTQAINATMSSQWNIKNSFGGDTVLSRTFSDDTETKSQWSFCIYPQTTNYTVSIVSEFSSSNYTASTNYIIDDEYSTGTNNVSVFLLGDDYSTLTQLLVTDQDNIEEPDIYINVQRYDLGTDTYYSVAGAKTDSSGTDLVYLEWYNIWYKFIGTKDGEVVFTDGPRKISESPVSLKTSDYAQDGYTIFGDIAYSLTYSNVTKNFILTYVTPSGAVSENCLLVTKTNVTEDLTICNVCETSSSATLYCNVGDYGNGTFIADYYASATSSSADFSVSSSQTQLVDRLIELINIQNQMFDQIGEDNGTAMAIIISGIIVALFLATPVLGVIGIIIGAILAIALGFQPADFTAMIGLIVVGIAVIWAVKK